MSTAHENRKKEQRDTMTCEVCGRQWKDGDILYSVVTIENHLQKRKAFLCGVYCEIRYLQQEVAEHVEALALFCDATRNKLRELNFDIAKLVVPTQQGSGDQSSH